MAQRSAASRQSTVAEVHLLPRLVHNSGPRSTQLPAAPAGLYLVETPVLMRTGTMKRNYQRVLAVLHLVLPHMAIF